MSRAVGQPMLVTRVTHRRPGIGKVTGDVSPWICIA